MIPGGDGLSATSKALYTRRPMHIEYRGPLRASHITTQESSMAHVRTNAAHRADMALAAAACKFGALPSTRKALPAGIDTTGGLLTDQFTLSPPAALKRHGTIRTRAESPEKSPKAGSSPASPNNKAVPPDACRGFLMGYGDSGDDAGFPGAPAASRGFPGGGHKKWSFERCPSLLPSHLDRDRGKLGRSCAGLPPAASLLCAAPAALAPACSAWHGRTAAAGGTRDAHPGMPKSRSAVDLAVKRTSYSGLQAVIGTTWDDSKSTAGGKTRGSDGKILGA
eukprot:TRINITY_DN112248_c0_g1_i1.p1 TRINITY_DN112248_c0_g1~~TRINITY_DN112248_c0_g1_i1.p1  ORF type:complete len:280 (-),score=35.43 TRINITY_DN112248_c0_g1_i1:117-956(-)